MHKNSDGVRAGPPWCCEKGEALNVAMCPDCIDACEGYQRAMSPSGVSAAPHQVFRTSDADDGRDEQK